MEKAMATPSSTLAWRIPGTREPGGLPSMGSHRVGHDWGTSLSLFTFMHWRRTWQPSPVFLPGESHGQRSLADYSHGVANSQTWLKWLRTLLNLLLEWAFIALKQRAPKHSGLKQQFIFSWLYGLGRMLWSLPQGAGRELDYKLGAQLGL